MLQKLSILSNLENTLALLNLWLISSRIGVLWCFCMMALLRTLGSIYIQRDALGFQGMSERTPIPLAQ